MKRSFFLLVAICICVVITGCTATDPRNLFETTTTGIAESVDSTQQANETIMLDDDYRSRNRDNLCYILSVF